MLGRVVRRRARSHHENPGIDSGNTAGFAIVQVIHRIVLTMSVWGPGYTHPQLMVQVARVEPESKGHANEKEDSRELKGGYSSGHVLVLLKILPIGKVDIVSVNLTIFVVVVFNQAFNVPTNGLFVVRLLFRL
jgi:hypothetical protein